MILMFFFIDVMCAVQLSWCLPVPSSVLHSRLAGRCVSRPVLPSLRLLPRAFFKWDFNFVLFVIKSNLFLYLVLLIVPVRGAMIGHTTHSGFKGSSCPSVFDTSLLDVFNFEENVGLRSLSSSESVCNVDVLTCWRRQCCCVSWQVYDIMFPLQRTEQDKMNPLSQWPANHRPGESQWLLLQYETILVQQYQTLKV